MYTGGIYDAAISQMVANRKSHFIASRLLARQFFPNCEVGKDEFGKPFLRDNSAQISWSHSGNYAALIACEHAPTGIDIEQLSERVLKIEDKFCNKADKSTIDHRHKVESLLLIWTAKESMYKLYGKKEVDFRKHMTVEPFIVAREGRFHARFHNGVANSRFLLEFEIFNDHIASWILGEVSESTTG